MKKFNFEGAQRLSREEMKRVSGGFRDNGCQGATICVDDSDCPHQGNDYQVTCPDGVKVTVHARCYLDQGQSCKTCHVANPCVETHN